MGLSSETAELLAGFEKRMKYVNIVRAILDYKYPDVIRRMFPDRMILDNVILAVLVFIKDRTLADSQKCTIEHVAKFLEDISSILPKECEMDSVVLSRYIIVDVLQNGGYLMEFPTYFSAKKSFGGMPIRLINEEKGSYHLTDDAFDFLFRSKEIESELDYSVTRFMMKEYMRRDNYSEALEQSRELVSRIRNLKTNMDDFLLRCRENISRITIDEYDSIILRIRSLLDDEYQELIEIQKNADERLETMRKVVESGIAAEDTRKHRAALKEIIKNISITIEEQRSLINKKNSLSESYQELLRASYVMNYFERLNFEKDIMIPLRQLNEPLKDIAKFLLFPLTKPVLESKFSIENFYALQARMSELKDEPGIDMTEEDSEEDYLEIRNQRYLRICSRFFAFASSKSKFYLSEFIESPTISELLDFARKIYCQMFFLLCMQCQE